MLKANIAIILFSLMLTGCNTEDDAQVLNSGRTDISLVQGKFRESILSKFIDDAKEELIIGEALNPDDADYREVEVGSELKAWREEIGRDWRELKTDQLDQMCEFFYEGLIEETSSFADIFEEGRRQLESQGTTIYSINNVRMREDNRKTIQFPTEKYSSSLFVCSSRIVIRLSNGSFSQPLDSTLAWNYYLAQGQRKFTFTFKLKS